MAYPGPGQEIALVVGLVFMSDVFVLLRIIARLKTKVAFGLDDYLIYACAILNFPYLAVNIWGDIKGNHGTFDLATLPLQDLILYLKVVLPPQIEPFLEIDRVPRHVLFFYRRIFGKPIYLGTTIILVLQSIWWIVCFCLAVFRCRPVAGSWNPTLGASCVNFENIVIAAESINAALDFAMIILPINVIRTLQLSRKQKVTVSAIFMLGGFVGIMAILRIVYTEGSNVEKQSRWVYAQINVGIVCACLPALKPIIPKSATVTTTLRQLISALRSSIQSVGSTISPTGERISTDGSMANRHDRYKNLSVDAADKAYLTSAVGGSEHFDASRDYPMDKIRVRHDVDVV
ncbi:MAG: hypothetical protein L6R41_004042 [Letrouitia leprolyta]|nr:MAG: hypothetical protein L6R41_004042 [Letrouitia leprolyta]